jgi:hypothetical protein
MSKRDTDSMWALLLFFLLIGIMYSPVAAAKKATGGKTVWIVVTIVGIIGSIWLFNMR